jgi:hypothetical protein
MLTFGTLIATLIFINQTNPVIDGGVGPSDTTELSSVLYWYYLIQLCLTDPHLHQLHVHNGDEQHKKTQ